jgi:hypothetical protein
LPIFPRLLPEAAKRIDGSGELCRMDNPECAGGATNPDSPSIPPVTFAGVQPFGSRPRRDWPGGQSAARRAARYPMKPLKTFVVFVLHVY